MPLTKEDTLHAKGIAIIGMVMLHLFCRLDNLPYTPLIWIGGTPLIYYLGLFGDMCVPIYCFCSGYAHYLLSKKQGAQYVTRIPSKLLLFLINYWIVVILFSFLGLLFDKSGTIPGSISTFIGNFLVVNMSYNGAWWFVSTYIFLLLLSPITARIVKKVPSLVLVVLSGFIYLFAYICRFNYVHEIDNAVLSWLWQQAILFGTSQFPYIMGMITFKCELPEKIRSYFAENRHKALKFAVAVILPVTVLLGHCIVQSAIVAPVTAIAVLTGLFLINLPHCIAAALLFLGKHSTNIWFVHMFFYLTLFKGLVFHAKYPIFILIFMFAICIGASYCIDAIYKPICKKINALRK